jgi:hypothetical protein
MDNEITNQTETKSSNMMTRYISAGVIIAILGFIGYSIIGNSKNAQPIQTKEVTSDSTKNESTGATGITSDTTKSYTLAEIQEHNKATDCWFAISGNVYDVTKFIESEKHKGGDAIIQGCGKDATELFNTRPMGSGTPHSDKARSFLPSFQIGLLKT